MKQVVIISKRWALLALVCMSMALWAYGQPEGSESIAPEKGALDAEGKTVWYDAALFDIEGKGWAETSGVYRRLPAKAEAMVPKPVWGLASDSAGICIRFLTDATSISARWTLTSTNLGMNHMPATGVSGLDLYVRDGAVWRWIGVGRPEKAPDNEAQLASGIPAGIHEYLLYLPLYNGVDAVSIGLPAEAHAWKPAARAGQGLKPICFYGTSICQGGCASRPGMAHTCIIGRMLDRPTINLGFSGNGKMEIELEQLLAEIDASVYVLDCLPNMSPELVTERLEPFVKALRAARPDTPIVLVENIRYQAGAFLPDRRSAYENKNAALRAAYDRLCAGGITGLTHVPCDALLGNDGEATVDGTHCTDLGFQRFAEALTPVLRSILPQKP